MSPKDRYQERRIREETLNTIALLQRVWLNKDGESIVVVIGSSSIHLQLMERNVYLSIINKYTKPPNCRKFLIPARGVEADLIAGLTGSILFILTEEVSEEVVDAIKSRCEGKMVLSFSRVEEVADLVENSDLKQDWVLLNENCRNADLIRQKPKYMRSRQSRLELASLMESCLTGTECLFFQLPFPYPKRQPSH